MGVISSNKTTLPTVIVSQDDFFPADYLIESPESTDVEDDEPPSTDVQAIVDLYGTPRRNKRSGKFGQLRLPRVKHFGGSAKQRLGARKLRRFENSKLLFAMIEPDDICEDLSDTLPETVSAFTQLFLESGKMKKWNDFVHKPEEEQQAILKEKFKGKSSSKDEEAECSKSLWENGGFRSLKNGGKKIKDVREIHPAYYSAADCYKRIDKNLKMFISHKHAPVEKLTEFESDLRTFFKTNPDGVWIGTLDTGYDRLLLHTVCQYLGLRSQSFDTGQNKRQTQVDNKQNVFTEPQECLASFIRRKYS